jgi:hypothetical protein
MPGFDPEDRQTDISGDPPPQRPLSSKQMAGAQSATVNRTKLPSGPMPAGKGMTPGDMQDSHNGQSADGGEDQKKKPGDAVDPSTPVLGGAQQVQQTVEGEARSALNYDPAQFNPQHPTDWLKAVAEHPVDTYFMGRHVWHALDAFFDPNAISESMFEIGAQNDAQIRLHGVHGNPRAPLSKEAADQIRKDAEHPDLVARKQQDDFASQQLAMLGDPRYLPMTITGGRGWLTVAAILGPTVGNAIFSDKHSPSDIAWGVVPALLFGGRLPPSAEKALVEAMPGAEGLIRHFGASQQAKSASVQAVHDNRQLIQDLMKQAQPESRRVVARAFGQGMKALDAQGMEKLEDTIFKQLEKKGGFNKAMLDEFGSMDPEKAVPLMVRAGLSEKTIAKAWTYGWKMPYDLMHISPEEPAMHWWTDYAHELPTEVRDKVEKGWQWTAHMVNQSTLGASGHAGAPEVSHWRSLIGHDRTNQLVSEQWEAHLKDVAGKELNDPAEVDRLYRALEGDETAYKSLSGGMRYVRDSMRMVAAGLRKVAHETNYSHDFVHNFWPRVPALIREGKYLRPMGRGGDVMMRQVQKHRALGVNMVDMLTESRMQVEQRYKTVQEANEAQQRLRSTVSRQILDGTPLHEIEAVKNLPIADWEAIERIRSVVSTSPEIAKQEAQHYADQIAPDFSTNPFDSIKRVSGYLRSMASFHAVNNLLNSVSKDGKALAVYRPVNDDRAMRILQDQGYVALGTRGFERVLVSSKYAELLQRATRPTRGGPGTARALADLEGTAVSMIMYSPRIHGMNMAARLGMLGAMHPIETLRWFKHGLIQKPNVTQIGHEEFRMEAWRAGVIPPKRDMTGLHGGGFADQFARTLSGLTGDIDLQQTPMIRDMANSSAVAKGSSGAKQVLGRVRDLLWGRQSDLWSWVSDFGVMAYHLEKQAAVHGGMAEADAEMYAARRANSWMGHVAPEDTNPNLHAIAKTVAFAPNWWRTWAELLTGVYKRGGFGWSPDVIKYVVQNEVKTAMAAVAFQQLTANAMNMMMSGHTIYQNDPGNWGKVEITAPWAIAALNAAGLGIDPKTGRDAKGKKLTMENPLARQMVDTEEAMGLLTGAPMWSPATMLHGASHFAAGRESPVASSLFALGNIDLYRSISSDGIRYIDPTHNQPFGNPGADLAAAALDLTPFASIAQNMQQAIVADQGAEDITGPFGLQIPKVVADALGPQAIGGDLLKMLLVGMTGVNPPYMRASKTFGPSPTDDQYKTVHDLQDTYQQHMTALSTSTLTGQMAPYQWLNAYRQLGAQHAAEMRAMFHDAPEYNYGPLGLTASWENIYDQALDNNGVLDADKLRSLQREWRASHSAADYTAVQSELRVNDQKYPMLALYHKTLDAYDNWQSDWCKSNGVSTEQLRSELTGYARVYNDRNASRQWLADHPDITQFETAKKTEFESGSSQYGMAGLMYCLFFNPTAADRYMLTSGTTQEQIEQQVEQQQVPTAP